MVGGQNCKYALLPQRGSLAPRPISCTGDKRYIEAEISDCYNVVCGVSVDQLYCYLPVALAEAAQQFREEAGSN